MAAMISVNNAELTTPERTWPKVQVVVRGNVARVFDRTSLVAEKPEVVAASAAGRNGWVVRFADGTEWQVQRLANCGCR